MRRTSLVAFTLIVGLSAEACSDSGEPGSEATGNLGGTGTAQVTTGSSSTTGSQAMGGASTATQSSSSGEASGSGGSSTSAVTTSGMTTGAATTGDTTTGAATTGDSTTGTMTTGMTTGSGGSAGSVGAGGNAGSGGSGGSGVTVPPSGCMEADKTICENEVATHCGLTYEFWRDSGGGCMVATADGFSMEWGEGNNVLARKGFRPGTGNEVVTYEAIYSADGTSFLGIYGWTQNPLVEYYIVDNWGGTRPPGDRGEHMGTIETDGGTYDIHLTQQVDKPSIEQGVTEFPQYWSVRTEPRTSGIITVKTHFDAWESYGMNMGNLYEVSFVVEGYMSSGSGDVRMLME